MYKVRNRLKTAVNDIAIQDRLQYNPEILEFHLTDKDLLYPNRLINYIKYVQEKGVKVYLHQPIKYKNKHIEILTDDEDIKDYYTWSAELLTKICDETNTKCVIHCFYEGNKKTNKKSLTNTLLMKEEIEKILEFGRDIFLWEDTTGGLFAHSNPYLLDYVIKPLNLDINLDLSHSFIAHKGDNEKLLKTVQTTAEYTKYLHIVDSLGQEHDSLVLGQGKIDWKSLKPYFKGKDFIFEIGLTDFNDCTPMIESVHYFNNI